jgi:superfamily I DNA/RNA helicase
VFVIGCSEGIMPHKDGELLEERRIFFVAASRAADRLSISYSGNRSQFLNDFQEKIIYEETEQNKSLYQMPQVETAKTILYQEK